MGLEHFLAELADLFGFHQFSAGLQDGQSGLLEPCGVLGEERWFSFPGAEIHIGAGFHRMEAVLAACGLAGHFGSLCELGGADGWLGRSKA